MFIGRFGNFEFAWISRSRLRLWSDDESVEIRAVDVEKSLNDVDAELKLSIFFFLRLYFLFS